MPDQEQKSPRFRSLVLFLSSNAGLGYAPVASGTFGTLAGIPVFFYLSQSSYLVQFVTLVAILFLSFWVCEQAGTIYTDADDGRIVIDELVGYLVTTAFLPYSFGTALLAFIWFRIFDILKPPPVSWFDREMKNGLGVTLDDVAAGIYAAILLRICLALFS